MHSKDGLHIVYARPALYQIQNGGYVIWVHVIPSTSISRGKKDFGFAKFYGACKLKIPREDGQTYLVSVKLFISAKKEIYGFGHVILKT